MNASHAWLQSMLSVPLSAERMRDLITARCCTVDEVVRLRDDLRDVVVGVVVEAARHPDSDHLWVTKVDVGTGTPLDVVCGAPNVAVGHKYPFAPAGSTLPGGLKLEKRKIRGAISNGMLCSARELRLSDDHQGILELDTPAPPGTPFLAAVPVGDARLVIDVTPNRSDLLSHEGVARELAAAAGATWRLPPVPGAIAVNVPDVVAGTHEGIAGGVTVRLEDPDGSPRYMGVVLRGLTVRPSPDWLAERIAAVGGRPINNVVDVTNYLLHEIGQPMHAFDVARLAGPEIVIRRARAGERLVTLDGADRALDPSMTVIADRDRPQAVAGVMGGATSEVTASTADIFLEIAHFAPSSVRRARRTLGLSTDASYRFERYVDADLPPRALARAVGMLLTLAGGRVDGAPVDLYPVARGRTRLTLRSARVRQVLGDPVATPEITALLAAVGFEIAASGPEAVDAIVPTWRPDVTGEIDLVEEVARLRGYETFSDELRPFRPGTVPDSPVEIISRRMREVLVARGCLETRPLPFVRGAATGFVRVANPLAENEAYLRRDLLDTLARRAEYNLSHMQRDVRLFEVGSVFAPAGGPLPIEELHVAVLLMGHRRPPHWTDARPPDFDEWDAKGLADELGHAAFPSARIELVAGADTLWDIVVDGRRTGSVQRVRLDAPVWAAPALGVELSLMPIESEYVAPPGQRREAVGERRRGSPLRYRALPTTPASEFDVALLVPNDLPAASVERVIRDTAGDLLEQLTLFDEYRGEGIPDGMRSLAWRLTFRHPERTLRDKEIAGRREKLLKTLEGELGVRQRTT